MNESEMTSTEFTRIINVLEKMGYSSDKILIILKYIESGDPDIFNQIFIND